MLVEASVPDEGQAGGGEEVRDATQEDIRRILM